MKAWRIEQHGGLSVLQWKDIPTPVPAPMEVRVRVQAVGLNHLDLWIRKGVPGHKFPLPLTPGCDVAGVIDEFGPGSERLLSAHGFAVGSRVLISPGVSCGRCEACLSGFDPLCPHYGILGEHRDGGCAEYVVVPAANLIELPSEVSFKEAAAIPIPYLTAWTMLTAKAGLRPTDFVLIHAGGSGVSVAAIQIAKLLGAMVITTVGSPEKVQKAANLGADHVIQIREKGFLEELRKYLTGFGRRGVDIVVDHVGTDTFSDSLRSLVWGGKLVTCGATSGSAVEIDLKPVFFKNISILGSTMGSKADLFRILRLAAKGNLKPVIHSTLELSQYAIASQLLEDRKVFGKVVVTA